MSIAGFKSGFWTVVSTVSGGYLGGPTPQATATATQGAPVKDQGALGREAKINRLNEQMEKVGVAPNGAEDQERKNIQKLYDDAKALVAAGLKDSGDPQCAQKVEKAVNAHSAEHKRVSQRVLNQFEEWKKSLGRLNNRVADLKKPAPGREAGEAGEIDKLAAEAEKMVSAGQVTPSADALAKAEAAVNTLDEKVAKVGEEVKARADLVAACGKELETSAQKPLAGATVAEGQDRDKLVGEARKLVATGLQQPTGAAVKEAQAAVQSVSDKTAEIEKLIAGRKDQVNKLSEEVEKLAAKPLAGETVAEAQERGKLVSDARGAVTSGLQAPTDTAVTTAQAALKDLGDKVGDVEKAIAGRAVLLGDMKGPLALIVAPDGALEDEKARIKEKVEEASKLIATGLAAPTDVAVQEAQKAVALATDERDRAGQNVKLRQGWKKRIEDAEKDVDERLKKVDKEFAAAVKADVAKSEALRLCKEKGKAARAALDEGNVKAFEDAAVQVKAQIDAREEFYKKAKALPTDLPAKENSTRAFRDLCVKLIAQADKGWGPIPASFMAGTPLAAEFGADRITIEAARVSAADLLTRVSACLSKVGTGKPDPADISEGIALVATALPNIGAAQKRVEKNHDSLAPKGLVDRVRELVNAAGRDDNKMLSNDRAGRIVSDFRNTNCTLAEVNAKLDEEVRQQHHPKLKDWLKVLQLATGGEIRCGKVGDVTPKSTGKRTDVHLTLHIVNVETGLPSVQDDADTILGVLLPLLTNRMGTHVTLELFGEKAPARNPHCFRNGTTVQNDCPNSDWDVVRKEMNDILDKEIDRLRGLVQKFIDRLGLFATDQRAG